MMDTRWLRRAKQRAMAGMFVLVTALTAVPPAPILASPAQYNPVSNAEDVIYPSNNPSYTLNTFQPIVMSPNGAIRVDNNVQNNYLFYSSSITASVGGYGVFASTIGINTSSTTGVGLQYQIVTGFANGALVLKTSPGFIAGIQVSSICAVGANFAVYDATYATTNAPQVAMVTCSSLNSYTSFDLATSSGLYVIWSGAPVVGNFGLTMSWR